MGPMNFSTLAVLCLLFISGALGSPSTNHTNGVSIARFSRKGTPVRSAVGLSDAERYARTLTRRKPTRRGTAQRRAPSPLPPFSFTVTVDLPPVPNTVTVRTVDNSELHLPAGNLFFSDEFKWILAEGPGSTITHTASPSWTSRDQQRLTYVADGNPEFYWPYFGASQCIQGGSMDLRPGSSDVVCLANIDSPGTPPDSVPVIMPNSRGPGGQSQSTAAETDIWTFDYSTSLAIPKWVNADGSSFPGFLVYDSQDGGIFITADVDATSRMMQRKLQVINFKFTAAN